MGAAKGYLYHHGPRTAILADHLAIGLGLERDDRARLVFAAILADVGMIGLAEEAWEDPVPELPPEVRAAVERHSARSEEAVGQIPFLEELAPIIRHHHEWWDGTGYPDALDGDEIPLLARILRVADTAAALAEQRPHRPPMEQEGIREVVTAGRGVEFDPRVAEAFLDLGADPVPPHDRVRFRQLVLQAADRLLPHEVPTFSQERLLGLFSAMVDAKDRYTAGHSRRVALLSRAVGETMGLPERTIETLWAGGHLHDVGKVTVPRRILGKVDPLSDAEFRSIRSHPRAGALLLEKIPPLSLLAPAARHHHERWDGGGYPEGLSGDRIPRVAQILAVCDAYDAITTSRAYRGARTHEQALEEVRTDAGAHFAPRVAEAFLDLPAALFERLSEGPLAPFRTAGRPTRYGRGDRLPAARA